MNLAGLVAQSYPSPEWAVFYEVSNATGFGARRRADAVALGVWPSRGNALVGFEFKEDRRDWLREKDNPAKAEEIAAHCDQWFVVAGKKDIVRVDELPEPWGLLVANEDRTRLLTVKACVPFADRDRSVIKRTFAAAMLRKVGETMVPKSEVDRLVNEQCQKARETSPDGVALKRSQEECAELRKVIADFEQASGVRLTRWSDGAKIGGIVRLLMDQDDPTVTLRRARKQLVVMSERIDEGIAAWEAAHAVVAVDPVNRVTTG